MAAAAMITVATTAFSITIVALQLASGQLGPRLLRNFIRDRGNQVVFGTFLGTFVYCVIVLSVLPDGSEPTHVPHLSIIVSIALTLAGVAVLIFYIHHAALSIQKDQVIARVSAELMGSLDKLYPKTIGREPEIQSDRQMLPAGALESWDDAVEITLPGSGYIQAVDAEKLMRLATLGKLCVYLIRRPGDYVQKNDIVARVRPRSLMSKLAERELRDVFVLGNERTQQQDVAFVFDQLVEIALRALSPALNDAFTAIRCVDRLGDALSVVAQTTFPAPYRVDLKGELRVITHPLTFDVLVSQVFYPVAESAVGRTIVLRRLYAASARIAERCDSEAARESVRRFTDYLRELTASSDAPTSAREELDRMYRRLKDQLGG
jgi:uncharacterized membrane protein